jgi:hypothetical protein
MINSISDNKVLQPVIAILLILFTVFMAPKLSKSNSKFINNIYFKIFFIIVIILLAKKHLSISLICLIIFFIIINNHPKDTKDNNLIQHSNEKKTVKFLDDIDPEPPKPEPPKPEPPKPEPVNPEPTKPFPTVHPLINGKNIPNIPISVASTSLTYNTISDTIIGSAIPITPNITPAAAKTIVLTNDISNNIISNIKNNNSEYTKNMTINEQNIRIQASNSHDSIESQQLINTADKLATARDAATSIVNNKDVETNNELLKSLVKSDLLKNASINAFNSGDILSAKQLEQASLSHANVANSFIQSKMLKSSGQTKLWDTHMKASLNIINYNNNMELSLDAFNKGDYVLSKKYQDLANTYLDNNITLNDNIKGITVENSNKLYEQVNLNTPQISSNNNCNRSVSKNINGIEQFEYANF